MNFRTGPEPVDRVCVAWYATLFVFCLVQVSILPQPWLQIGFFGGVAGLFFVLHRLLGRYSRSARAAARAILLCIIIPLTFEVIGKTVPYTTPDAREQWLVYADRMVFGSDPTRWIGSREYFPAATELLIIIYSLFYFLSLLLAARLILLRKLEALEHTMLVVVAGFLFSYFGYLLIPGRSPYHLFSYPFEFEGLAATPFLRTAIRHAEAMRYDAFPSGHCDVTWLVAACAFRHDRRSYYFFFLPVAILLPISTVYLRYHYGIDVLAAVLFACMTWFVCERLWRARDGG